MARETSSPCGRQSRLVGTEQTIGDARPGKVLFDDTTPSRTHAEGTLWIAHHGDRAGRQIFWRICEFDASAGLS